MGYARLQAAPENSAFSGHSELTRDSHKFRRSSRALLHVEAVNQLITHGVVVGDVSRDVNLDHRDDRSHNPCRLFHLVEQVVNVPVRAGLRLPASRPQRIESIS
jgi:hypothetical protein